jgi:hypothetical protein
MPPDYFQILFKIARAATTPDAEAWARPLVTPAPSPTAKRFLTLVPNSLVKARREE